MSLLERHCAICRRPIKDHTMSVPHVAPATKWRKRPVVIEAVTYDADKAHNVPEPFRSAVCRQHDGGVCDETEVYRGSTHPETHFDRVCAPHIHTLEGPHLIRDLDVIIRGVKGEFYPCKPDIFEATYEAVE